MGALIRFREQRIERHLRHQATSGHRPIPSARRFGTGPEDPRHGIPPLGLREYWYPALPSDRVGAHRPTYWRMLGDELCLFRDEHGEVAAISDVCPHRGATLSGGRCFYRGTVACPYHGAVFDATGRCRAFLTEGPDSKMPATLSVRAYPTVDLRGWVWIWMGEGEPVEPALDIPPELFEPESTVILSDYTYWPTSWVVAIENQGDAHNALYVHRNSLEQLVADRSRKRTPIGPRSTVFEDRAVVARLTNARYYERDGEVPFQMWYEGVRGRWPLTRWRQRLWRLLGPINRHVVEGSLRKRLSRSHPYQSPEEWGGGGQGRGSRQAGCWHLPCAVRVNTAFWMHTRFAVPVTEDLCRVVYLNTRRTRFAATRVVLQVWFRLWFRWLHFYNFSGQDAAVAAPCRYWTQETLAPTDSHLVRLRALIVEGSRDARRRAETAAPAADATAVDSCGSPAIPNRSAAAAGGGGPAIVGDPAGRAAAAGATEGEG